MDDVQLLRLCDIASQPGFSPGGRYGEWRSLEVLEAGGGLAATFASVLDRRHVVVCFRGSAGHTAKDTLWNVWDDFRFWPRDGDRLQRHQGIVDHTKRLVEAGLASMLRGANVVTFCGMSLGGGVATLAPLELRDLPRFRVVTFGAPMVSKAAPLVERCLESYGLLHLTNYVMRGDLPASLPPGPSWNHPGDVVMLPRVRGAEHSRARYLEALESERKKDCSTERKVQG